jgi:hypothetical protein
MLFVDIGINIFVMKDSMGPIEEEIIINNTN